MNVLKNNFKSFFIIFILTAVIIITAILEKIPKVENFLQSIQGIISPCRLSAILLILLIFITVVSVIIARKIK